MNAVEMNASVGCFDAFTEAHAVDHIAPEPAHRADAPLGDGHEGRRDGRVPFVHDSCGARRETPRG